MTAELNKKPENNPSDFDDAYARIQNVYQNNVETIWDAARMELFTCAVLKRSVPDLKVSPLKNIGITFNPWSFLTMLIPVLAVIGVMISSGLALGLGLAGKFSVWFFLAWPAAWICFDFLYFRGKRLEESIGTALLQEKDALMTLSPAMCDVSETGYSIFVGSEATDRAKGTALMIHADHKVSNKDLIGLGEILLMAANCQKNSVNLSDFEKTFCRKPDSDCNC